MYPQQQKLRDNKGTAKLTSVFGNPAREKILFPLVKRICSSVRNSFRQDVSASYSRNRRAMEGLIACTQDSQQHLRGLPRYVGRFHLYFCDEV
jgi:hypothetical protein